MTYPKPATMKGDIVLTRDVEVVEMKDLSAGPDKGTSWNISAKKESSRHPTDWMDGFRRAERRPLKSRDGGYQPTTAPTVPGDRQYDLRAANAKTANTALARELKGRHLQMIAFGGAIGMSLFLQSHPRTNSRAGCGIAISEPLLTSDQEPVSSSPPEPLSTMADRHQCFWRTF